MRTDDGGAQDAPVFGHDGLDHALGAAGGDGAVVLVHLPSQYAHNIAVFLPRVGFC